MSDHEHGDGTLALPAEEPIPNPGLPEHQPRPTDVDVVQERRTERQVSAMFGIATLLILGFCVAYFAVPVRGSLAGFSAMNLTLGLTLGGAMLLIGLGAIQWAKKLMTDNEIVEMRHPVSSSPEDRQEALAAVTQGAAESGFGRRKMIRNSLLGALGALGLPAVVMLRDLGPLPGGALMHTVWAPGMRVVNDVAGTPIKPSEIEIGQLVNAEPEIFFRSVGGKPALTGTEALDEMAKAAVIMVRMRPEDINAAPGRENWGVDGILCYSKICTHVGCPIALWEQQTHHVLCPCHQSTFDLANNGKVIFGPAHRSLPQLPLKVDQDGYLVAQSDFTVVVGPSFPTM
ncbi:MAG: cytochrome bc1 complex Rieske iron-sulfur subunit [Nocardioidaceae bacterium]